MLIRYPLHFHGMLFFEMDVPPQSPTEVEMLYNCSHYPFKIFCRFRSASTPAGADRILKMWQYKNRFDDLLPQ